MKCYVNIAAFLTMVASILGSPCAPGVYAQTTSHPHQVEFQKSLKAAQARLQQSLQAAQAQYLEDVKRAQSVLESHLALQTVKSQNSIEQIVTVAGAEPGAVKQGQDNLGWSEIPAMMKRAVIFTPQKDQPKDGVVQFVVHHNAKIGLAASWAYDGNASGGWQEERKSKSDLKKMGWVEQGEMYLNLYDRHTLFVRDCEKGERISIRTRKYYRPYVFIPNAIEPAKEQSAPAESDAVITVAASQKMDTVELLDKQQIPEVLVGTECYTSPLRGVALVKAHRMCKVFVAASWENDGNSSGQWTEERWTEATFEEKGWEEVGKVKIKHRGSKHEHKLFVKVFNEGEQARIRTRKYGAPYVFATKVSRSGSFK